MLILVGILAAIVLSRMQPQSVLQLPQQAASLAADLRHLQALALTGSERLCFEVHASGYRANRYDATAAACETATLTDPASGQAFERNLAPGIVFDPASLGMLQFDSLGRPVDGAGVPLAVDPARHYLLLAGDSSASVTVQALTGRISP